IRRATTWRRSWNSSRRGRTTRPNDRETGAWRFPRAARKGRPLPFGKTDNGQYDGRRIMRTNPKPNNKKPKMKRNLIHNGLSLLMATSALLSAVAPAQAQDKKPNIVFIMGDDIGMWNIGDYHCGMMAGRTPNLDRLAKEGMLFTDYYAESICTAGRANFTVG